MPPGEGAPEHHPYTITSQEKTQEFTPDGRFIMVWKIGYESTTSHVHAFVTIPDSERTPAHVDQVIQEELDKTEGIHELGPEPHPENLAAPGEE
jgi:hypothetical protein